MDWSQAIAVVGALGTFSFWLFTKLDSDIKSQNQRIDQLYQMFVDLLKEKK